VGVRGRAVVFVGDEDHGEEGFFAQEAGVVRVASIERPAGGLERVLVAAAVDAQLGDAGEGLGKRRDVVADAATFTVGLVDDERAGRRAAALDTRLGVKRSVVAVARAAGHVVRTRTDISGDHPDMQVEARVDVGVQEPEERVLCPRGQRRLLFRHGARIVDHEEEVDGIDWLSENVGGQDSPPVIRSRVAVRVEAARSSRA